MSRLVVALVIAALACTEAEAQGRPAAPHGVMVPGGFKSFGGKVLEKLDVPQYSYLRVATGGQELWAAVPRADRKVGDEVTIVDAYAMEGFESRELNRKFEVVWFGGLGASAASDAATLAAQHKDVAKGPEVKVQKVARAPGADGRTVEEVWRQRRSLNGRPVSVRGKVVKATAVMGKSFLHLRDGTGSAAEGTDDLPVTTSDGVAVGDVVTATGIVVADKDFGSGYTYRVLVEGAKLAR
jgi:hypothetical protein